MTEANAGMPVDELIAKVKDALIEAGVTSANHRAGLRVRSVQLILEVIATGAIGGRLNFHVPFFGTEFAVGGRRTQRDTHTIDITLVPSAQPSPGAARGGIRDVLVEAIRRVRQTVASASEGEDPWCLSTATVDISFGVTKDGTISVTAESGMTSETTNTLRLSLAPT
jgi:hypothetical protein